MKTLMLSLPFFVPLLAQAEGTDQLGLLQALRADTTLAVDIVDASTEQIVWNGVGAMTVTDPLGATLGTFASGSPITPTVAGAYVLQPGSDQVSGTRWDVAVTGAADSGARLHSTNWKFNAGSFAQSAATEASFYALVPGGLSGTDAIVELKLDGLAGYVYDVNANAVGVDGDAGGRSVPVASNSVTPEHPIYLGAPSVANYGAVTPTLGTLTFASGSALDVYGDPLTCAEVAPGLSSGTFTFTSDVDGTYHLQCDLNGDGNFDTAGGDDLLLIGAATSGSNTVEWGGLDNAGDPVPSGDHDCRVRVTVGEFHYVGQDIETSYEGMRLFEVSSTGDRTGLTMYWDDADVQANAQLMDNGELGLETSGPDGMDSGLYASDAVANVNVRSWGAWNSGGKGNQAFLDTWTWLREATTAPLAVTAVDGVVDTDGDGITDHEERCEYGTDPALADTDGDGIPDGEQHASVSSSPSIDSGLESNGRLASALAARSIARSRGYYPPSADEARSTLIDLLPQEGPRGAARRLDSPSDLPGLTNATDVLAADYVLDSGRRVGSVLVVETVGERYEHTKALCDRAGGRLLVDAELRRISDRWIMSLVTVDAQGSTRDHARVFELHEEQYNPRMHSGWLPEHHPEPTPGQRILSIQVWAPNKDDADELTAATLAAVGPHQVGATLPPPSSWISRVATLGGRVEVRGLRSGDRPTTLRARWRREDGSWTESHDFPWTEAAGLSLPPFLEAFIEVVDGPVIDRVWLSDGAWAPWEDRFWGAGTTELTFSSTACAPTDDDEVRELLQARGWTGDGFLRLAGCASTRGTVDRDGGLARHLGGGFAPADISQHATLLVKVSSAEALRVCLESTEAGRMCADRDPEDGVQAKDGPRSALPGSVEAPARWLSFGPQDFGRTTFPADLSLVTLAAKRSGPLKLQVSGLVFSPEESDPTRPLEEVPVAAGCHIAPASGVAILAPLLFALALLRRRTGA